MCGSLADVAVMLQPMAGYDTRGIASIEAEIAGHADALRGPTWEMPLGVPDA